MKVLLARDISGTRNGQPWPPAGAEIELPDDEAATLVRNGDARALGDKNVGVETRFGDGIDEGTARQIARATVTRERQSRSKRAHEPTNLGIAEEQQPAEDVNGPRLPEVHAEDSAKVEAVKPDNPNVAPEPVGAQQAAEKVAGKTAPKDK